MLEYLAVYHVSYQAKRGSDKHTNYWFDRSSNELRAFDAENNDEAIKRAEGEILEILLRDYSRGDIKNFEGKLKLVLEARNVKGDLENFKE
tara:strand:- start:430 stop:702 length:273 start_codon:yes stop_codon:yes gene_type:complete